MIASAGAVLVASLIGSPHCAGMCGGFVCFYAGQGGARPLAHLAYNAGRLITYLALGALAGALGAGVERVGASLGFSRAAAALAGAMMIAWGAVSLARALGRLPAGAVQPAWARRPIARALRAVQGHSAPVRALIVGLVTTLLPCGWLYAFVAVAAGTGSPAHGALVMAAFWLGTLPILLGVGLAAQGLFGALRSRLPAISAAVLIVLGVLTIAGRMAPGHAGSPGAPACHPAPAAGAPHPGSHVGH